MKKIVVLVALLLGFGGCVAAQSLGPGEGGVCVGSTCPNVSGGGGGGGGAIAPQFKASASSNANSSNGDTVSRKQLTNCAEGWNGTRLTPTNAPVGERYCNSLVQSAAEGAGGPTQGVVAATASGAGILPVGNGENAGGNDSPTAITDTYGGTSVDSFCSTDTQYAALVGTVVHDIAMPACTTSSSLQLAQTAVTGFGNADSLWPSSWNMSGLDHYLHAFRWMWFRITGLANLHDLETDTNFNTSAGFYNGWGAHWNETTHMWQACPQGCNGWTTMRFTPVGGGTAVTSYPLTEGHVYFLAFWYHREDPSTCTPTSGANCYWYDYAMVYDVTAGETAKLYTITDTSGNPLGGIPQDRSSWSKNLITDQFQIDQTRAGSVTIDVSNDGTIIY